MKFAPCLCVLFVSVVFLYCADARKTFSSRRKSGGSRRGSSTSTQQKPPPPPVQSTPNRADSSSIFLNRERAGSSHSTVNTHYRGSPFDAKPSAPEVPKHTNGPIGFEGLNNRGTGNQKLGFDKVNSEVQRKPAGSSVPNPPAYTGTNAGAPYPKQPMANSPNGPPPAYPGYGSQSAGGHAGGYEPPPAYPGRPVNAPPVYSANNPNYPTQGFGGYHNQPGSFPGQGYPGQQYSGFPNSGNNFGGYPNQGYNQGFGSFPGNGYGQSYPGYGGNTFGGSPFGQSPSYGGSPFGHSGFGGNSFGNPHYSPNNFGYSSKPGLLGSLFGGSHSQYPGYNNIGYHKKSRFGLGGMPLPIPIPIPIPMGMFGGLGGFGGSRSREHRLMDAFMKNQTINNSGNNSDNVYILNNSTVTPCTTDQFVYDSLNVTIMSCTATNCTSIKMFVTTNSSSDVSLYSAGLTLCTKPDITFSTFADNVNPSVSDVHRYWMKLCQEVVPVNTSVNVTGQETSNVTVKITETVINETVVRDANATSESIQNVTADTNNTESTSFVTSSPDNSTSTTVSSTPPSIEETVGVSKNSTDTYNSSNCDIFDCSWIEMCIPSVEIPDRCSTPVCPTTKTVYRPCIKIKMCQSPSTPISTFATFNNTVSRVDHNNVTATAYDVANLTLIYIPPSIPTNCSQNATDPACQLSSSFPLQEACVQTNTTESASDGSSTTNNATLCNPYVPLTSSQESKVAVTNSSVEAINDNTSP